MVPEEEIIETLLIIALEQVLLLPEIDSKIKITRAIPLPEEQTLQTLVAKATLIQEPTRQVQEAM
jgi:hypothetical protein